VILFIGEAPSHPSEPEDALAGPCGERLARLLGITLAVFLEAYGRVNLVPVYPDAAGTLGTAETSNLQQGAATVWVHSQPGDRLVLCGRRVARAFRWGSLYLNHPVDMEGRRVLLIAHPSGRCRLWNDPAFCARTSAVLRRFVEEPDA
jgi:uracil-DNA glycosylase